MKTIKVTHDIMQGLVWLNIHKDLRYDGGLFEVTLPDHIADAISIFTSNQFESNYAGMRLDEYLTKVCGLLNRT